jgi:hypothetical protein
MLLTDSYFFLNIVKPNIAVMITITIKIKKITLAIEAAPEAISVKPKTAATIAINKKIAVHLSIVICFDVMNDSLRILYN